MKISDFLKKENIIIDLKARTKEKAFEEIINNAKFSQDKKKLIYLSLMQREILGTTGIGNGIAIPHARSVVLNKLHLHVGVSSKGIEYDAMDGKPVHLVFLIMAPPLDTSNQYLILLGKVAALSKKMIRKKSFLKLKTEDDFIKQIMEFENNTEDDI